MTCHEEPKQTIHCDKCLDRSLTALIYETMAFGLDCLAKITTISTLSIFVWGWCTTFLWLRFMMKTDKRKSSFLVFCIKYDMSRRRETNNPSWRDQCFPMWKYLNICSRMCCPVMVSFSIHAIFWINISALLLRITHNCECQNKNETI